MPRTRATTRGLDVHNRTIAVRGVNGAIASNFRQMTSKMGGCIGSNGPHAFLRGVKSIFITVTTIFFGVFLITLIVVYYPILFMLTVMLITIMFTTVTMTIDKKTLLCRLLPTVS